MEQEDSHSLEVIDLIADQSFHNWVFETNEQDIREWSQWIQTHPEHRDTIVEAKELVKMLAVNYPQLSRSVIEAKWQRLQRDLSREREETSLTRKRLTSPVAWGIYAVAASIFLLLYFLLPLRPPTAATDQIHITSNDSLKLHTLPDGSTVVLNLESSLHYTIPWDDKVPRNVRLEGEAFFDVKKNPKGMHNAFVVSAGKVSVNVLGTSFSVSKKVEKTQVFLKSGEVKLTTQLRNDSLMMSPGDFATYQAHDHSLESKTVNPNLYLTWVSRELILEQTPLEDIAEWIEDQYDVNTVISNPDVSSPTLSGKIKVQDFDFMLEVLEKTFDLEIQYTNNTLIFSH